MRSRVKRNKFQKFIYLGLFIIFIEAVVYFAQAFSRPPQSHAQTSQVIQSTTGNYQQTEFKLPILIYHYVEYVKDERDTIRQSLNIQPNIFELQIQTLISSGYTFVTPNQIAKIETGRLKVEKPVILSFDDGYRDFYTDVFPILKKHNIRAVAYVNPGLMDKLNYMYWDQVGEIVQSGLVEIGSHGVSHQSLSSLDPKQAEWEIQQSKSMLENKLGITITSIAYPYGHYNSVVADIAKSAGYTSALTTNEGTNENTKEKFTLKRIHPGTLTQKSLINKIEN